MNFSEMSKMIELLGKDRGVDKEVVVNAIEQAFLVTARKKYGIQGEYEARYNEDDGEIELKDVWAVGLEIEHCVFSTSEI